MRALQYGGSGVNGVARLRARLSIVPCVGVYCAMRIPRHGQGVDYNMQATPQATGNRMRRVRAITALFAQLGDGTGL